jgi:hypothetical protein
MEGVFSCFYRKSYKNAIKAKIRENTKKKTPFFDISWVYYGFSAGDETIKAKIRQKGV